MESLLADEPASDFLDLLRSAAESTAKREFVSVFATAIGSLDGISGYMYHTVPCVIQVWLRYTDDFAGDLWEIISAGGDTDTTGAILGAIIGARVGSAGGSPLFRGMKNSNGRNDFLEITPGNFIS